MRTTRAGSSPPRHARRLPLLLAVALAACGDSPTDGDPGPPPRAPLELGVEASGQLAPGHRADTIYYRVPRWLATSLRVHASVPGLLITVRDTVLDRTFLAHAAGAGSSVAFVLPPAAERALQVIAADQRPGQQSDSVSALAWRITLEPVDSLPEWHDATLGYAQAVEGTLDGPGDVDVFRFAPVNGDRFVVFLRVLDDAPMELVLRKDGTGFSWPSFQGPDPRPFGPAIGPYTAVVADYTLRLTTGSNFPLRSARYRLEVLRVPERSAAVPLSFHTNVAGALSPYGEIDEYSFTGAAGDMFRLVVLADPGVPLRGGVSGDDANAEIHYDAAAGAWVTHPFEVLGGAYRVELGHDPAVRSDTLPYVIRLFRADRAPETLSAALTTGVLLSGEAIDSVGDVDEFTFALADTSIVNTVRYMPPGTSWYDAAISYRAADGAIAAEPLEDVAREYQGSAHLAPGTYHLRMTPFASFTGPYEFAAAIASIYPEDVPRTLAIGDTVVESTELIRDRDTFDLTLAWGDRVTYGLQSLSPGEGVSGLTGHAPGYWVVSPAQSPEFVFSEGQDFVGPGDFRLLIGAGRGGASWQDAGAYRLTLMRLDTLLEAGGAPLAIGDSSVQAIDARRDVDRFRVAGAPGSTVRVQIETSAAGASLEVFDPSQQRWVRASYYGTAVVTSAPVVVPPSGSLAVDVLETCASTVCTLPNQYTLRVLGPGT